MKKLIFSFLLIFFLSISFISAGLCRGYDGYYHDCDDSKYFNNYRNYDDGYYYHGKYYPVRDYYYRDYYDYNPRTSRYRRSKEREYYNDVEEYSRVIEYDYENRYGYENIKTTIFEKTEIESDYEIPYYVSGRYRDYGGRRYRDYEEDENNEVIIRPLPWHYSLYKEYY